MQFDLDIGGRVRRVRVTSRDDERLDVSVDERVFAVDPCQVGRDRVSLLVQEGGGRVRSIEASVGRDATYVLSVMGRQPDRKYSDPEDFNEAQKYMAEADLPIYRKYVPAKGEVWLYEITDHRCLTILFSEKKRVDKVIYTWWEP